MATAALRLDEYRALRLDDKISKYLDPQITVGLKHSRDEKVRGRVCYRTSGFADFFYEEFIGMLAGEPGAQVDAGGAGGAGFSERALWLPGRRRRLLLERQLLLLGLVMQKVMGLSLVQGCDSACSTRCACHRWRPWEENTLGTRLAATCPWTASWSRSMGSTRRCRGARWACFDGGRHGSPGARDAHRRRAVEGHARYELLNNFSPMKGRNQDYGDAVTRVEWGGTNTARHVRRGRGLRRRHVLRAGQRQHDHRGQQRLQRSLALDAGETLAVPRS